MSSVTMAIRPQGRRGSVLNINRPVRRPAHPLGNTDSNGTPLQCKGYEITWRAAMRAEALGRPPRKATDYDYAAATRKAHLELAACKNRYQ